MRTKTHWIYCFFLLFLCSINQHWPGSTFNHPKILQIYNQITLIGNITLPYFTYKSTQLYSRAWTKVWRNIQPFFADDINEMWFYLFFVFCRRWRVILNSLYQGLFLRKYSRKFLFRNWLWIFTCFHDIREHWKFMKTSESL